MRHSNWRKIAYATHVIMITLRQYVLSALIKAEAGKIAVATSIKSDEFHDWRIACTAGQIVASLRDSHRSVAHCYRETL